MNTQQLENINKEPINQAEIEQVISNYKLTFLCPHCDKEINDDHFSERQKSFQYLKTNALPPLCFLCPRCAFRL